MKTTHLRNQCVRILFALLLLAGFAPTAWADQWGHEKATCYSAYEKSPGVIHFKVMVTRKVPNSNKLWLASATNFEGDQTKGVSYITMSRPGHEDERIIEFYSGVTGYFGDESGNLNHLGAVRWIAHKGAVVCTTPVINLYPKDNGVHEYNLKEEYVKTDNGDERAMFVEWDWYMPYEFIGQDPATFKIHIECKGVTPSNNYYYYASVQNDKTYEYTLLEEVSLPSTQTELPQMVEPQIAIDLGDGKAKPGMMMLNIINTKEKIYSYQLPNQQKVTLTPPDNLLTIYVPISDTVRSNYRVKLESIFNGDVNLQKDSYDRILSQVRTYNLHDVTCPAVTIPAYHRIHDLTATWAKDSVGLRNGDVRLSWNIYNASATDAMENDMFVVERAAKADFSDAEQIVLLNYSKGKSHYVYIDQSDAVKRQDSQSGHYYYRVSRASTMMWTDMAEIVQSGLAAQTSLRVDNVRRTRDDQAADLRSRVYRWAEQNNMTMYRDVLKWTNDSVFSYSLYSDTYLSFEQSTLDFHYQTDHSKSIYQPTIDTCKAVAASDWNQTRRVLVSAEVPQILIGAMGTISEPLSIGNVVNPYITDTVRYDYPNVVLKSSLIEPEETNIYWDKERTLLFLVRRMIIGTDTTDLDIPVPADSVHYNPLTRKYEIRTSDVADVPCARYEYYFRLDGSNTPFPIEGNLVSQLAVADSKFYFNEGMHISDLKATDRTSPDFTALQWETAGGDFQDYEVWRTADTSATKQWSHIATVQAKSYLDRKAPIGVPCLYKVIGLLNCDATLSDTSAVAHGQRDCYGSISGYVTYTNGTVRPGTQVQIISTYMDTVYTVVTDENGYYFQDELWFCDEGTSYDITIAENSNNEFLSSSGARLPLHISLNGWTATITDVNIQYTQCKRMEGRVLYEHSTVPVPHVHFLLDGRLLKDKSGSPLETDASGNFDLMVESGKHTIQVVKEGHTFSNNGFFTDENGNDTIRFTENLYGKRIYDTTRIRVAGRVTGGLTEGTKPLGLGLSTNTLGDSLTLVFELEGDNISRFVYYPTNASIIQRDTVFHHVHSGDSTTMRMEAKRIVVHPDARTGEYMVELFPARYRVTQAYAKGYATLFPAGMTSQAIDMSDASHIEGYIDTLIRQQNGIVEPVHLPYNYRYQITYRSPINLRYQQLVNGMPQDYLGDATMHYDNVMGQDTTINLVLRNSQNQMTGYVFGYPVFSSQAMRNKYTFRVSATEDYYYNNEPFSAYHWQEFIVNKEVTLFNGMNAANETHRAYIDPVNKYATIDIQVNNPSFVLTGEDALRQIEIGMETDGLYVYAEPIRGYVTGRRAKGVETLQSLSDEITLLDIIRDPYGAHSYSYVESGTSYHAKYHTDWDWTLGLSVNINTGPDIYTSTGTVLAPMGMGSYLGTVMLKHKTEVNADIPIQFRFTRYLDADYICTTTERIQTSSDPLMVGAMADIYVGTMHHTYAGMIDAVSIIDSTQYRLLQPAIRSGKVHVLSVPQDSTPYYLVVGEQTELGLTQPVEFVYTQKHIINHVLPRLIQQRNAMLMEGTHDELQAIANATDTCVYRSLVAPNDPKYGLTGGYEWIKPAKKGIYVDDINRFNLLIKKWGEIIAQNEKEKVDAKRLGDMSKGRPAILNPFAGVVSELKTYSVTAGADITYRESTEYTHANDWHWRWGSTLGGGTGGIGSFVGQSVASAEWFGDLTNYVMAAMGFDVTKTTTELWGYEFMFGFAPIIKPDINTVGTSTFGNSKTAGFVLSTSDNSYEDITVYHLYNDRFNIDNMDTYDDAMSDISDSKQGGHFYADYVFVRRGGATQCPYEGEEQTIFYTQGNQPVQLAAPTLHISRPTLSINKRELSNVPMDQPATFVLTISNESDLTYDPNIPAPIFLLRQDQATNADGLIIKVDGQPIMNGLSFPLGIGQSIQKTMQVYRGTAYDYDSIRLILRPDCDINLTADINFNVHYQPVSCPVSMTMPVQNWIMNTLSQKDDKGYYLPVEINGFDIHYDNFDHIDFQYKLKTQSNDQWTTQCSFYADSALYALASGNKAMIENGQISNVRFYGERDPMEQQYDLRAVSYCRLGNDFITRASEVRSGLKDTRVPSLFGVATPANGILQVGDYISIPFSEPIAANYLDEDYNFEVVGYTNQSKVNKSTSLSFPGSATTYAVTELDRNLSNKDFTVDLILMPARKNQEMTYIMQGNRDTYIGFGQSYDPATGRNRLAVHMADPNSDGYMLSEPINITTDEWMHVVASYRSEDGAVEIYLNGKKITTQHEKYPPCVAHYAGVGPIVLGAHPAWPDSYFEGKMLEIRIWNKVLSASEVMLTYQKQLNGYESALAAYYPFDEGQGTVAYDKVGGSVMLLNGLTWPRSEGRALELQNTDIHLNSNAFLVGNKSDFTYTMWFRIMQPTDSVNLFSTASLQLTLTRDAVIMRKPSEQAIGNGQWMDQQWHFLAVTANHSTGIGNLYVDNKNVAQFNANDAQGPDSEPIIGPMNGQIDDITLWEMALPEYYLQHFYRQTPNNTEMGLLVHLSFSERVLNDTGDHYYTRYNPYNDRIRKDELGNVIPRTEADRIVITSDSLLSQHMVEDAPIQEKGDLVKLGFNWIGQGNELVINLKMLDKEINKQNIFVTVRNVEDLAGNPQQSPLCWTLFVDRNQLRWSEKYIMSEIYQGESATFTLDVLNQGGTVANYYLDELPWWLTTSAERGSLSPLEQRPLTLRVSDQLDPGQYETIIYLTDDNLLSEPLLVSLTVKARQPEWQINPDNTNGQTMNIFAQVLIAGAGGLEYIDTDTADIVSAFLGSTCLGVEHIMMQDERALLCMSLLGNTTPEFTQAVKDHKSIRFLLWRASTGKIYVLSPKDESAHICYEPNTLVGQYDEPLQLHTTEYRTQPIDLQQGWNWISFYIDPDRSGRNFADALTADYTFHNGDFIKCGTTSQSYEDGEWYGMPMHFYNSNIYMVRAGHAGRMGVHGQSTNASQRKVNLRHGWNQLPYISEQTQDINTALASYRNNAQPGDVVKAYRKFAILNSNYQWVGSLTHMQPGVGYMLYRQDSTRVTLQYQMADQTNMYAAEVNTAADELPLRFSHNMPIVATVAGATQGDRLMAYEGNEPVGIAEADEHGRFMLMTSATEGSKLSFRYQSAHGEQYTAPVLDYKSSVSSVGTATKPYEIVFDHDMATVYPDPFTDHLTYSGVLSQEGSVELSLYAVNGQCIWQHTIEVQAGQWQYSLTNTDSYPKGFYIGVIRTGETSKEIKLIHE